MLLENDEELPSDCYAKIKGVEVPLLGADEKLKIDEFMKKSDSMLAEGRIVRSALDEVLKSLRTLESALYSQPKAAPQDASRILGQFSKAVEEKLESNAYSIENLSRTLEGFSERISMRIEGCENTVRSLQNSIAASRERRDELSTGVLKLQNLAEYINSRMPDMEAYSSQAGVLSRSISERIDFLASREKSIEDVSSALIRSSDNLASYLKATGERLSELQKRLSETSESVQALSSGQGSIAILEDGMEYLENASQELLKARKESDEKIALMESSLAQMSSFMERLASSYVDSTTLLRESLNIIATRIENMPAADQGHISSEISAIKDDVISMREKGKDDSIRIENSLAALNKVLEKQDRIDQKASVDIKNLALMIEQLNEKDNSKFQVLEEKMAFIERSLKDMEEKSAKSAEELLGKLQTQIGAAYDSSLTSIEELARKHAQNEDKMVELVYKIEIIRDSLDIDGIREKIENMLSRLESMEKSQEESAGRLVYDIKFLSTSAEAAEKRLVEITKWLEELSENGILESRNSDTLSRLSKEIEKIGDSQKVISQSLNSLYDDVELIRSNQEGLGRSQESSINEMSAYIEDSLSRHVEMLDDIEEKIRQVSRDLTGYRQSFNSLDERISLMASELAIERGKTENAIKSIFDRLDEIHESQRFASKISIETLEKLKEDIARNGEKTHSKMENISTEVGTLRQNQDAINQGVYYNINSLKNAIEDFTRAHSQAVEVITKPKKPRSRRKMAAKPRVSRERKPRAAVDSETIAMMDHSILNALSVGKRRSTELSHIIKGDSRLFRTRLNLLVDSGKVIKVREGKFVYFLLA